MNKFHKKNKIVNTIEVCYDEKNNKNMIRKRKED